LGGDKVSIVIPVHNSKKFLRQSIESAINQTYEDVQVLAIENGSKDDSHQILKEYHNDIDIVSVKNKGLGFALKTAIENANGNWFKILSADDVLKPNAVSVLVEEAKKLPENTIIYSNWELIDEHGNVLRKFSESNFNELNIFDFNIRLLDGQKINVNTTLIPTSLFRKGCVFEQLENPVPIDYDFFLRAGIFYDVKFHLIEDILLEYRIHSDQLSHKDISKSLNFVSALKKNILSQIEPKKRTKYFESLEKYQNEKPISKKTMEAGLKIVKSLPPWASDTMIVFYLNKIRRTR